MRDITRMAHSWKILLFSRLTSVVLDKRGRCLHSAGTNFSTTLSYCYGCIALMISAFCELEAT
jgi:hypothetical protein